MSGKGLTDQEKVVLGALLHDIGKFWQRTGEDYNDYEWQNYCPSYEGRSSHHHAAFTARFLAEHFEDEPDLEKISASHHMSREQFKFVNEIDEALYAIVKKADHLASGHDRKEFEEYQKEISKIDPDINQRQQHYKTARLESIFDQLTGLDGSKSGRGRYFYPLKQLSPETVVESLPDQAQDIKSAESEYAKLWQSFKDAIPSQVNSQDTSFSQLYLAWCSLLEQFLYCMPASAYKNNPNVSLYDHSRVTAAFADCVYRYHKDTETLTYEDVMDDRFVEEKPRFRLLQGDFSGIQEFIFSKMGQKNKYAAKLLRARSFFVSIATEIAAYMICDAFEVTPASVVMNAGGKFTMLLPNLSDAEERIARVEEKISRDFHARSFGQTRLFLTSVPATDKDFYIRLDHDGFPFNELLKRLHDTLAWKKARPVIFEPVFKTYLSDMGRSDLCDLCGIRFANATYHNQKICSECKTFAELGQHLITAKFISLFKPDSNISENTPIRVCEYSLKSSPQVSKNAFITYLLKEEEFSGRPDTFFPVKRYAGHLPKMHDVESDCSIYKCKGMSQKDIDDLKSGEKEIKTFAALAYDAVSLKGCHPMGKPYLAVLKADVDNLGYIFSQGFQNKDQPSSTFSLTTALSRTLDYFFTGWLIHKIKTKYQSVYTVFAGGDDLFLIGPYTQIIKLAQDINTHLARYTGNHPAIHLSAGIVLTKPMIPVYEMAEWAEAALAESKKFEPESQRNNIPKKNAVTLFEQTISWHDFPALMEVKAKLGVWDERLKEDSESRSLSTGFVYNLLTFAEKAETQEKHPANTLWRSQLTYSIHRNYKKYAAEFMALCNDIENHKADLKVPVSLFLYERRR